MKKIMHPTVDPAKFFLDVYARMSSPLLQNPSVCPCGHWQVQQCIQAPLKHRAAVVWLDESQGRFFFLFLLFFFFWPAPGGGGARVPPPPLDPLLISSSTLQARVNHSLSHTHTHTHTHHQAIFSLFLVGKSSHPLSLSCFFCPALFRLTLFLVQANGPQESRGTNPFFLTSSGLYQSNQSCLADWWFVSAVITTGIVYGISAHDLGVQVAYPVFVSLFPLGIRFEIRVRFSPNIFHFNNHWQSTLYFL